MDLEFGRILDPEYLQEVFNELDSTWEFDNISYAHYPKEDKAVAHQRILILQNCLLALNVNNLPVDKSNLSVRVVQ